MFLQNSEVILPLSEDLLFVWEPTDLVMSWHAPHPAKRGEKTLVKNLLWWVKKFLFQREVVLCDGLIFGGDTWNFWRNLKIVSLQYIK